VLPAVTNGQELGLSPNRATLIALAITVIAFAITAAMAYGASTRAEYVAQVDPICQAGNQRIVRASKKAAPSIKRILAKVKKLGEAGEDSPEAKRLYAKFTSKAYGRYASIFHSVTTQITAVPPGPGDEAAVAAWLEGRALHAVLLRRAIRKAKRGKTDRSALLVLAALAILKEADDQVRSFGFQQCVTTEAETEPLAAPLQRGQSAALSIVY
jgi:hypothetical protein